MSDQPIVSKETPVQSNPFARALPGHVNAGAVAIESERAIAEAQGKLVIAKRFPRDQAKAYANIMDACKRPGLAEEACYSFPRGGKAVSGPSIRLTEMLAANWGNVDYGLRELSRREGVSEMEAYCWDLETNTMSSQKFTVRHIRDKTGGNVTLTDERDIYELTANMGARRLRARILAIIPADLAQAAVNECEKTLAGSNEIPMTDRVRNMVNAFNLLGISSALIEGRLGHPIASLLPEELADLRKIHASLKDNISKPGDWFGDSSNPDLEAQQPEVKRPEPKPRRGAAAAKATATEVVNEQDSAKHATATTVAEVIAQQAKREHTDGAGITNPEPKNVTPEPEAPKTVEQPKQAPAADKTARAFLKDGEKLIANVEVVSLEAVGAPGGPDGKQIPSVRAVVKGDYNGKVQHKGGGKFEGDKIVPAAPWEVGARITLHLAGKKSTADKGPMVGQIIAWVEKAEAMTEDFG